MVKLIVCQTTRLLFFLVVFLSTMLNIMVAALPLGSQAHVEGQENAPPVLKRSKPGWLDLAPIRMMRSLEGKKLPAHEPLTTKEKWLLYYGSEHVFHAVQRGDLKWEVKETKVNIKGSMARLGTIERLQFEDGSKLSHEITERLLGIEGDNPFQALDNAVKFLRGEGKSAKGLPMPPYTYFQLPKKDPWNPTYSKMQALLENESVKEPETSSNTENRGGGGGGEGKKRPFEDVASDLPPPQRPKTGSNPALLPQGAVTVPKLSAQEEEQTKEAMGFGNILSSA
ncbi:hypothetical protein C8R42DRAFT_644191 [Lentinula raphanica]|nr:hypothetical protein C8R42DRAFT_644191 [Lentinula raphanica]